MNIKKIIIKIGQYISDILKFLPSNAIILKEATNIGATERELTAPRNSLLAETNVPVIKGKKRPGIFGVYEGVDVSQIVDYLRNEKYEYKKIMVTPESFGKVKEAAAYLNIDLYNDYFFLFDECDKTMKDVGYREDIILPMKDFFLFKNKAFISATAVIPSDPRFLEHGFINFIIEPDYDYQKPIQLINTNNASMSLKSLLKNIESECICIFFNSIQGIQSVIKDLGISDESNIYCSKKKAAELSAFGLKRAHENLTTEFAKYNFFTSRFNAAVDIKMDVKPTVIMVTNLHIAHHTVIDPNSDAIQIVGRFRNGVSDIHAIANFDPNLGAKTPVEAIGYLEGCEESYNVIKTLRTSTTNPGALDTLNQALQLVKYSSFVNDDGSKNYFMVDNFLYGERVKMLYQDPDLLLDAYRNKHFAPTMVKENFFYSDLEDPRSSLKSSIRELTTAIINALRKLEADNRMMYSLDNREHVIEEMRMIFPEIVKGYYVLGPEELARKSYSKKQIMDAVKEKLKNDAKSDFAFINTLQSIFPDGYAATTSVIKKKLLGAITEHELDLIPTIELLKCYFEISSRTSIKGYSEKGYRIYSCKFAR